MCVCVGEEERERDSESEYESECVRVCVVTESGRGLYYAHVHEWCVMSQVHEP